MVLIGCCNGLTIHSWHVATGIFSSSFYSEKSALTAAITWLHQHDYWSSASVTNDCKSLIQALSNLKIHDSLSHFNLILLGSLPIPKQVPLIGSQVTVTYQATNSPKSRPNLALPQNSPTSSLDQSTQQTIIHRSCFPSPSNQLCLTALQFHKPNPLEKSYRPYLFPVWLPPCSQRWQHGNKTVQGQLMSALQQGQRVQQTPLAVVRCAANKC